MDSSFRPRIDNNLVENAIRPTAIGKKNWLFFGSAEAGRTSAIHYTLLETCRKLASTPKVMILILGSLWISYL